MRPEVGIKILKNRFVINIRAIGSVKKISHERSTGAPKTEDEEKLPFSKPFSHLSAGNPHCRETLS